MPASVKTSFTGPFGGLALSTCAVLSLLAGAVHAGTMPQNLGSGLDSLVEANIKLANETAKGKTPVLHSGYATEQAANAAGLAMMEADGRVQVRVHLNGIVKYKQVLKRAAKRAASFQLQAADPTYHGAGVFEAWVSLDDVPVLAGLEGVSGVFLTPRPIHARLHRPVDTDEEVRKAMIRTDATTGETLNIIGTVFDFGVTQHRVDQINQTYNPNASINIDGTGISIGDLSDSFDTAKNGTTAPTTTAATDEASGDLPSTVTVFVDDPAAGTDEGRAMCQTLHKMAPGAKIAFATADISEIGFADAIRNLAQVPNPDNTASPVPASTFKADVIVDDVSYLDEPFFQDGIIAQGVNDVVAAGVSYFSSAANNAGTNGYDSDFNFIPNDPTGSGALTAAGGNTALANTNIDLTGVPAAAYAGGFHNFNPAGTVAAGTTDVAQLVNFPDQLVGANYGIVDIPEVLPGGIPVVLQWNDPDNTTTPAVGAVIATLSGNANALTSAEPEQSDATNTMQVTLGNSQEYYLKLTPTAATVPPGTAALDGQIEVYDSAGNLLIMVDNNGSGAAETSLFFTPGTAGTTSTYIIRGTAFQSATAMDVTMGPYTLTVAPVTNSTGHVTENLNLLVFTQQGVYLSADSITTNNIASGSPIKFTEFLAPTNAKLQFVIGRSIPAAPDNGRDANHFRYLCFGDGILPLGPAEYFSYTTPLTFGHSSAAGANSVAAYPYYKPNIPEYFTSPGPSTVYFDAASNYIGKTVRLKPDIAAMDGANTSFFGADDAQDTDASDNFFGTSDAAPHAAAIGALVLQAAGGPGKLSPAQLKTVLQSNTFPHDLDPYYAKGVARTTDGGKVTIIVKGDDEDSKLTTAFAQGTAGIQDVNAITVKYEGPGSLSTLVFNPTGLVGTAGNLTDGTNGLTTPAVATGQTKATSTYFETLTPGIVFDTSDRSFELGTSSTSLTTSTVSAAVANGSDPNSIANSTLTLMFTSGAFAGGDVLRFTIGRDEYQDADSPPAAGAKLPNGSADIFGGGVNIPDGLIGTETLQTAQIGMAFSGTTSTGATFGTTSSEPGLTNQTATIRNRIGAGYSALDGFGFINAEAAVKSVLPAVTP